MRAVPYKSLDLPSIRSQLQELKRARVSKDYMAADAIRESLLHLDSGMKINISPAGKISLWHWPAPPFTGQFHFCNYGEFIANSEGR